MKRPLKDNTPEVVKAFAREMYNQVPPLRVLNICGYLLERYCAEHENPSDPRVFGSREWQRGEEIPELDDLPRTIEEMLADGTLEIRQDSDFFSLADDSCDLTETQKEGVAFVSTWLLGKSYEDARKWIQENSNTWRAGWDWIVPNLDLTSWDEWTKHQELIKEIKKEVDETFDQLVKEGKLPNPKK